MGEAGGGSPPRPRPKGRLAGLAEASPTLSAGGSFGQLIYSVATPMLVLIDWKIAVVGFALPWPGLP